MQTIGYPPLATAKGVNNVGASCGEHCDYGWLTIVNQDSTKGALQVKNKRGEWINADPIPGSFVMNIGDMLKLWSNGVYQSTPHRVLNNGKQFRVSIPFFYEPSFDSIVEPHPIFGDRHFEGIKYGDFLTKKVQHNFDSM